MAASPEDASRTAAPETVGQEIKKRATVGTGRIGAVRPGRTGPARRICGGTSVVSSTLCGAVAAAISASEGLLRSREGDGESASSCISGPPMVLQKVCEAV